MTPELRTARATDRPCELYEHTRSPIPARTQGHHRHPVYLQNRVYGRIQDPELLWLCGLCHDNVHEIISWLLGEGRRPEPMPGRKAIAEAKRTVDWYRSVAGSRQLICGHVGPRGTTCIELRGHRDSHGDGSVARWITR